MKDLCVLLLGTGAMLTKNNIVFLIVGGTRASIFCTDSVFGLTRFIETGWSDGSPFLLFRWDLIPWICSTGIFYGMMSLALAILMSGWMPAAIALRGGWFAFFGIRAK